MITFGKSKDMVEKMAGCNLDIQIDHKKSHYQFGETVTGQVLINADKNIKCKHVVVSAGYKAHGRGNTESADCFREEVFSGTITPGQHSYPFSIQIKGAKGNLPNSHQGHYINIDWFVFARAYISWRIDPRAEEYFVVRSDRPSKIEYEDGNLNELGKHLIYIVLSGLLAISLLLFPALILKKAFDIGPVIVMLIGCVVAYFSFYWFRRYFQYKRYGHVQVALSKSLTKENQLHGQFILMPNSNISVDSIRAYLEYEEITVSGSGTSATTYSHDEVIDETSIAVTNNHLMANEAFKSKFTLTFPKYAAKSFDLSDNNIQWRVKIVIDEEVEFTSHVELK